MMELWMMENCARIYWNLMKDGKRKTVALTVITILFIINLFEGLYVYIYICMEKVWWNNGSAQVCIGYFHRLITDQIGGRFICRRADAWSMKSETKRLGLKKAEAKKEKKSNFRDNNGAKLQLATKRSLLSIYISCTKLRVIIVGS